MYYFTHKHRHYPFQITISGILSAVTAKKQEFKFYNSNTSGNEQDFINTIDDSEFIQGFSLIFDKTYDEKFNFDQFINAHSSEDPTVEIQLFNSRDSDHESEYQWVSF